MKPKDAQHDQINSHPFLLIYIKYININVERDREKKRERGLGLNGVEKPREKPKWEAAPMRSINGMEAVDVSFQNAAKLT